MNFIDIPIDDPRYKNSYEGGLAVTLAVVAEHYSEYESCHIPIPNVFVSDQDGNGYQEYFPNYEDNDRSYPFKALLHLAKTSWSGYDWEEGHYWYATLSDLTIEGQTLITLLEKLYPDDKIVLLTFLNT